MVIMVKSQSTSICLHKRIILLDKPFVEMSTNFLSLTCRDFLLKITFRKHVLRGAGKLHETPCMISDNTKNCKLQFNIERRPEQ